MSLQDIHGELEAREIEAWQNLIRVLTHEIMNSATPISSLAATAAELLAEARAHPDRTSAIDDAHDAVETIAKRSSGLVHFVESYRRLTRVPKPALRSVLGARTCSTAWRSSCSRSSRAAASRSSSPSRRAISRSRSTRSSSSRY